MLATNAYFIILKHKDYEFIQGNISINLITL